MTNDKKRKLFFEILNTYINGNISDYRERVLKLNKLHTLEFIEYCQGMGTPRHTIINSVRIAIESK